MVDGQSFIGRPPTFILLADKCSSTTFPISLDHCRVGWFQRRPISKSRSQIVSHYLLIFHGDAFVRCSIKTNKVPSTSMDEKEPQSIILLPPCLTVGIRYCVLKIAYGILYYTSWVALSVQCYHRDMTRVQVSHLSRLFIARRMYYVV